MQAKAISPAAVNILQTLSAADNPTSSPCTLINKDVLPSRPEIIIQISQHQSLSNYMKLISQIFELIIYKFVSW